MKNRGASMCVFVVMKSGYFVICDDYSSRTRSGARSGVRSEAAGAGTVLQGEDLLDGSETLCEDARIEALPATSNDGQKKRLN
jgi:hypothetical protein